MPSEEEVSEVLETISEHMRTAGEEITHKDIPGVLIVEPNPELGSLELRGHRGQRNDSVYYIGAHPEISYVRVSYFLSIVENIAAELNHDSSKEVLQAANLGWNEGEAPRRAAKYLLNNFPRDQEQAFRARFKTVVLSPLYETAINMSDSGRMESYSIDVKLFPYEEGVTVADVNEAIQTVVGAGRRSAELVWSSLSTEVDENNLQDARLVYRR